MALQGSGAITLAQIQTEFGGANPISLSEYYRNGAYVGANNANVPTSGAISLSQFYGAVKNVVGQIEYTTQGLYSFVVPAGVTSVCVVCVGPATSTGGALSWANNIAVTPGQTIEVGVAQIKNSISCSYFSNTTVLYAGTGTAVGGASRGGGGQGGAATQKASLQCGGAAGYSGNGGAGAQDYGSGVEGQGGGGGGRGAPTDVRYGGGGGGGVGLLGQGTSGVGGGYGATTGGKGGFGGSNGGNGTNGVIGAEPGNGGAYGGGGLTPSKGAVRIIWGSGRAFPSTNTGNL